MRVMRKALASIILALAVTALLFALTRPIHIRNRLFWSGHELMLIDLIVQAAVAVAGGVGVVLAIWWAVLEVRGSDDE